MSINVKETIKKIFSEDKKNDKAKKLARKMVQAAITNVDNSVPCNGDPYLVSFGASYIVAAMIGKSKKEESLKAMTNDTKTLGARWKKTSLWNKKKNKWPDMIPANDKRTYLLNEIEQSLQEELQFFFGKEGLDPDIKKLVVLEKPKLDFSVFKKWKSNKPDIKQELIKQPKMNTQQTIASDKQSPAPKKTNKNPKPPKRSNSSSIKL